MHPGQTISQSQADQFLREDLKTFESGVRSAVHVPMTQGEFDACVSLAYNIRSSGFAHSQVASRLNQGDYKGAQAAFANYNHAAGKVMAGLTRRRAAEAAEFGGQTPSGGSKPPVSGVPKSPAPPHHGAPHGNYTVQPGDTMSGIAKRQGVPLAALEKANPQIHNFNRIQVGQVIHLGAASHAPKSSGGSYTVRPGDSLTSIAAHHGVSLGALEKANPQIHNFNRISVGQLIHLPGNGHVSGPAPAPAAPPKTSNYVVRSGDTMSGIASHHGVSLGALERANPQISDPNRIRVGQTVHIPGGGKVGGPAPTAPSGPVHGTSAAAAASKYLGRYESDLQRAGVTMHVDTSESCANFVTAMLKQVGKLPGGFSFVQRVNVGAMSRGLQNHGWHRVSLADARPGDVWIGRNASHTEIVASNDHGKVTLIGSNNYPVRSNQRINLDSHSAYISGSYILAPR